MNLRAEAAPAHLKGWPSSYHPPLRDSWRAYQCSLISFTPGAWQSRGRAQGPFWALMMGPQEVAPLQGCGPTHVARLEFPRETGLILRCAGKANFLSHLIL